MNPRYDKIALTIKRKIARGALSANGRLPSRNELLRMVGGSKSTLQKGMSLLKAEGFIRSRGRNGTFVTATPPNISNIPVILQEYDGTAASNRYFASITDNIRDIERVSGKKTPLFRIQNVKGKKDDFGKLQMLANSFRIQGSIFASYPDGDWMLEPLMRNNIPTVAFTEPGQWPGLYTVWGDYDDLIEKSLAFLRSKGCGRVGMLNSTRLPMKYIDHFYARCSHHSLKTGPQWVHGVSTDRYGRQWIANLLALMFRNAEKPDAVLVTDENITPFVADAITGTNVTAVSQSSLPKKSTHNDSASIRYIGFDVIDIMSECIHSVVSAIPGTCTHRTIAAKWADEMSSVK